jgi:hypothetical protein
MRRVLVLVLALYVLADFAWPLMPGSVKFDPDDCVDAIVAPVRENTVGATPTLPPPPPARDGEVVTDRPVVVRALERPAPAWAPVLSRARLGSADSPSAPADH